MKILVIGGAGYIGSHTCFKLLEAGHEIAIFDNLVKGHREVVDILREKFEDNFAYFQGDLLNFEDIEDAVSETKPDAVIHFAAFSEVGESVKEPYKYYSNNITGGLNLLSAMRKHEVKNIVFSSTAAVFGQPEELPIKETTAKNPINPYGRSKLAFENILEDFRAAYGLNYAVLRYFNACGADENGLIGEDHTPESHLIPLILEVAQEVRESISVFGTDYETPDGTCIRDYVHVYDLADAHIKAVEYISNNNVSDNFNLGNGTGYSVREIINCVEQVTGKELNVVESPRREGDPAILIADNTKAKEVLGWTPKYNLEKIVKSAWEWEQKKGKFEY